ncbi:unnamed protein product [Gordionus sp. m RMFG-2023]|uniref:Golgi-associated PDZ and coiled-coil motif-containing protein-like n=1 Tax=Gordionus sp. m RMFG-2023 TaxID=3053472 RepID=UPI0030E292ED
MIELEKEFDKNYVDLYNIFEDIEQGNVDKSIEGRIKLRGLGLVFAQVLHKISFISQNNNLLNNEILRIKENLINLNASNIRLENELDVIVKETHQIQLDICDKQNIGIDVGNIKQKLLQKTNLDPIKEYAIIKSENILLKFDLDQMKKQNLNIIEELYDAKIATKYLCKELSGRVQQIQILRQNMDFFERDKLWKQLESEINLLRQKIIVKACRAKVGIKDDTIMAASDNCFNDSGIYSLDGDYIQENLNQETKGLKTNDKAALNVAKVRTVVLRKRNENGFGLSITGGKDHAIPILISEIHAGQSDSESRQLQIGDAILSINGISLRSSRIEDAIKILGAQVGDVVLEVEYVSPYDSNVD